MPIRSAKMNLQVKNQYYILSISRIFFINFYEFHEKEIFIYDGLTFFVASNPNDPNTETGDQRVKSPEAPVSPRISSR